MNNFIIKFYNKIIEKKFALLKEKFVFWKFKFFFEGYMLKFIKNDLKIKSIFIIEIIIIFY